jgi:phenylpyruvate tautomerase PptA (4-oxalocrotonate tautomerase family)
MPYINIYAYSGRDMEMKKKTAEAIVKAASEAMNTPEDRFTVFFNDVEKENWEKDIEPIFEPLKDNMLLEEGKLL